MDFNIFSMFITETIVFESVLHGMTTRYVKFHLIINELNEEQLNAKIGAPTTISKQTLLTTNPT